MKPIYELDEKNQVNMKEAKYPISPPKTKERKQNIFDYIKLKIAIKSHKSYNKIRLYSNIPTKEKRKIQE